MDWEIRCIQQVVVLEKVSEVDPVEQGLVLRKEQMMSKLTPTRDYLPHVPKVYLVHLDKSGLDFCLLVL